MFHKTMSSKAIYLDYAAGTPVSPLVLKEGLAVASRFYGNPSALHAAALEAKDFLNALRSDIAEILSVKSGNLVFTAGATEANNLIALSLKKTYPQAIMASLNIDHDSQKLNADYHLEVNPADGRLRIDEILKLPANVCCLSLAGINNELGVVQPFHLIKQALAKLREERRRRGESLPLFLHVDASQMALTHSIQPQSLAGADLMTLNGAKFYAFKQSGLLYVKSNLTLKPPFLGGGQEQSWRPGGESLLLASGLKTALQEVYRQKIERVEYLRGLQAWFEERIEALGGEVVLRKSPGRSPHITPAIFANYDNETLAFKLSNLGIYVGIGSACHSRSDLYQSSALKALGYQPEQAYGALRFSFAYETSKEELAFVLKSLSKILNQSKSERRPVKK